MKIKDIFDIGGISQAVGGLATNIDHNDGKIVNKKQAENALILELKRDEDGNEAHARLKVRKEFEPISTQLLGRAFRNPNFIGLTLNQLDNLETDIEINRMGDRLMLKP